MKALNAYIRSRERNTRNGPRITEKEFQAFLATELKALLATRAYVFEQIMNLARSYRVPVTYITQPNALRTDYEPFAGRDLREYPIIDERNTTLEQADELLEMINQQTRDLAKLHGASLIDASREFRNFDPSDLFYDSVHYTEQGSRKLAEVINKSLGSAPDASQ